MDSEPLFYPISEAEYEEAHRQTPSPRRRGKAIVTEPRNQTTWYAIDHFLDFCTCPAHDEIQAMLSPEKQQYRQLFPTRMVFEIKPGMKICRDCFIHEGDKDDRRSY